MLKRTVFAVLATLGTLAFAASAQAAYLTLGTTNPSNAPTTLSGNTAGSELLVKNTNGSSTSAFGLYGLLSATSPTVSATAVRGQNSSTNGKGFGVYGSQAGSGTGVRGFAPGGKGIWGSSTSGTGVLAEHTATSGAAPALSASTNSSAVGAFALYGLSTATAGGDSTAAVRGQNKSTNGKGYGVYGSQAGSGTGVHGSAPNGMGVSGSSTSGIGLFGNGGVYGVYGNGQGMSGVVAAGVYGTSAHAAGVIGTGGVTSNPENAGYGVGVYGIGLNSGVHGYSAKLGVQGEGGDTGVYGYSNYGVGTVGASGSNDGIEAISDSSYASAIYAEERGTSQRAGWFQGNVLINGTCTGCTGPSALQIDDPLDPAHKYLQHSSVASSQQLDVYSGNATTNRKGFATVKMPKWFQALNGSFRYQLTILGHTPWDTQARVWDEISHNRFTIRTNHPRVRVSWQVMAVRHDRYAAAHPTVVIAPKSKADQGNYLHPELYGKPRSDGIGYRRPPNAARVPQTR